MGKVEKVVVMSVVFLMAVIIVVTFQEGSGDVQTQRVYGKEKAQVKDLSVLPSDRWKEVSGSRTQDVPRSNRSTEEAGKRLRDSDRRSAAATSRQNPVKRTPKPLLGEDTSAGISAGISAGNSAGNSAGTPVAQPGEGLLHAGVMTDRNPSKPVATDRSKVDAAKEAARNDGTEAPSAEREIVLQPGWHLVSTKGLRTTRHPEYMVYTCSASDTFEAVATRFYGSARHAGFLRRNNEGVRSLPAGTEVLIPCINRAPQGLTYTVKPGDSLWTIAREHLGAGSRWKEIYEVNKDRMDSPDDLREKLELRMP